MQTKNFIKKMADGGEVWCNRWIPDDQDNIKGVVQLHHGLSEHCLRYDRLGSVLAENGYVLSSFDVRGHGHTGENAEQKDIGHMGAIARTGGDKIVVDDLFELISDLKKDYKGKKIFLVGHSFGSFVSQAFIENFGDDIDGCVLIGTAGPRPDTIFAGQILTELSTFFFGPYSTLKYLPAICFAGYNKRVENPKSSFAWLSKNEMNVQLYEMDNWCGIPLTTSFFRDMMKLLSNIHKPNNMKKIPKNLPVLMMYGSDDPVGNYGKTIKDLFNIYTQNGMTNVEMKVYEGDRHEILNEDDKENVENELISWMNKLL